MQERLDRLVGDREGLHAKIQAQLSQIKAIPTAREVLVGLQVRWKLEMLQVWENESQM